MCDFESFIIDVLEVSQSFCRPKLTGAWDAKTRVKFCTPDLIVARDGWDIFFRSRKLFFNNVQPHEVSSLPPRCTELCCAVSVLFTRHGVFASYMPALVKLVVFSR